MHSFSTYICNDDQIRTHIYYKIYNAWNAPRPMHHKSNIASLVQLAAMDIVVLDFVVVNDSYYIVGDGDTDSYYYITVTFSRSHDSTNDHCTIFSWRVLFHSAS